MATTTTATTAKIRKVSLDPLVCAVSTLPQLQVLELTATHPGSLGYISSNALFQLFSGRRRCRTTLKTVILLNFVLSPPEYTSIARAMQQQQQTTNNSPIETLYLPGYYRRHCNHTNRNYNDNDNSRDINNSDDDDDYCCFGGGRDAGKVKSVKMPGGACSNRMTS